MVCRLDWLSLTFFCIGRSHKVTPPARSSPPPARGYALLVDVGTPDSGYIDWRHSVWSSVTYLSTPLLMTTQDFDSSFANEINQYFNAISIALQSYAFVKNWFNFRVFSSHTFWIFSGSVTQVYVFSTNWCDAMPSFFNRIVGPNIVPL